MTLRIRVEQLGDEVRECLDRGEAVEIERDGEVVALIPARKPKGGLQGFVADRRKGPPLDDRFEADMEEILRDTNRPTAPIPWDS